MIAPISKHTTDRVVIGICGAGNMGLGIAQVAAKAGASTIVYDNSPAATAQAAERLSGSLEQQVAAGRMSPEQADSVLSLVSWTNRLKDLAEVELVIEAIIEREDVKTELFQSLESIVSESAILATNTSSLSVSALAAKLIHPGRFMGLHFFNPATRMKLVEVVCGLLTDPALSQGASDMMRQWGKSPVPAKDVPGFIVNRVARPFYAEGWRAYEEGVATAAEIDHAFRAIGHYRMGPLELGDLIGHDINFSSAEKIYNAYFGRTRFHPSVSQALLVGAGMLGQKSGAGVYRYGKGETQAQPSFRNGANQAPEQLAKILESPPGKLVSYDGVAVGWSFGPSASALAERQKSPVVLLDHSGNSAGAGCLAAMSSDAAARKKIEALADRPIVHLADRAGGLVFRTQCQLANSAADAIRDFVASADEIDEAMLLGVNYPVGPISWARQAGFGRVCTALDAIADETGEGLYRPSEVLRKLAREQKV
ncbi:3-hydroxyacyl-CoA dehydrogenase NAD-binding domain-containing protein [Hyphomonas sp.]|uniref:3-hydroxyacyl-CoA dehydrogenase NAD-binding domain-containing protein n=1 Tax=Hyphomonas sp. TaxID=87 RepID=UPI0025C237C7|nr:3-hydroxyacyl-CoA dehydrogenase NAD-binding domain-containing protein [Hyphomonas sp.]